MSERDPSVDRWERTWKVFHAVLESPASERAEALKRHCAGDPELRREVEELLAAHGEGLSLIDGPPLVDLTDGPAADPSDLEETAVASRGLLEPGTVLANRFEVVRLLGAGGMGEVYEAHDRELGTRVAVKTLLAGFAANPVALARFRKEILLARQVTHRNVCRIFDLVQHESLVFLTMEFLEGETLASRIRREGRMDLDEARDVLEQLVAGLETAHAVGVVHRDLKPSNVLLVEEDGSLRAVITDFGLATSKAPGSEEASQLTGTGEILGTPAYMAPEQLEGGETDASTDIYSLGLLLYEMVTGRMPFTGSSPFSIASRRLEGSAPSPRTHVPDLDRRWEEAILRCLERRPGDRYQAPREILQALDDAPLPVDASPPAEVHRTHRTTGSLITVAVLAVLVGSSWMWWRASREPLPGDLSAEDVSHETSLVLVSEFDNRTGEELLSGVLDTALSRELVSSRAVGIVPPQRVADTLRLMGEPTDAPMRAELSREVALRDGGIALVVGGRVEKLGSRYMLSVDLTRPEDGELIVSLSEEAADQEKVLDAVHRLAEGVQAAVIGQSPGEATAARLPAVSTPSLGALKLYAEADQLFVEEGLGRPGRNQAAEKLLREAIAEDPEFASAYLHLAYAIVRQGRPVDEAIPHAEKALELSDRASPVERAFIRASYHGFLKGRGGDEARGHREEEIAEYQALLELEPNHFWAGGNLVWALEGQGRGREAAELAAWVADTTHPNNPGRAGMAAWFVSRYLGDVENARRYHERTMQWVDEASEDPSGFLNLQQRWRSFGSSLTLHELWLGDEIDRLVAEVQRQAEEAPGEAGLMGAALTSNAIFMSLDLGMYRRAEEIVSLSGEWTPEAWERLMAWRRQDFERLGEALPRDPGEDADTTSARALDLANAGLLDAAEVLLDSVPESMSRWARGNVIVARATIEAARGEPRRAVSRLEEGMDLLLAQDYLATYFMAAVRLAAAYRELGYPDRAVRVLEEASRQRSRMIRGGRFYWMLAELHRADLYRELGRDVEADEVEARLWTLSSYADPDFPILVELERRSDPPPLG